MTPPPPAATFAPPAQVTPASQPGSQEEIIEALQNLDDPAFSPEKGGDEGREKTPEKTAVEEMQSPSTGGGSARKRTKRTKRVTSKGKKLVSYSPPPPAATTGEESKGRDPSTLHSSSSAKTPSEKPEKLVIKLTGESKGSGKKK